MKCLQIKNLSHAFGPKKVLTSINLEIDAGEIVAVIGGSGTGKTTLLKAILGTHPPTQGEVLLDGQLVLKPTRRIGIVYQNYPLYDYLTARENVAFGLKLDQTSLPHRFFRYPEWRQLRQQHLKEADKLLKRVHLEDAIHSYPAELSGGMKQRVAIAQALIMKPRILLLDEPFGALDEATRESLQLLLLDLFRENLRAIKEPPHTIIIVTHELNEALYVANRVVGLSKFHPDGKNGATIVYDKASPVLRPDNTKDFEVLVAQKEEIRSVTSGPEYLQERKNHVSFWEDIKRQERVKL